MSVKSSRMLSVCKECFGFFGCFLEIVFLGLNSQHGILYLYMQVCMKFAVKFGYVRKCCLNSNVIIKHMLEKLYLCASKRVAAFFFFFLFIFNNYC